MKVALIITIAAVAIFYIGYIVLKYKVTSSISASYNYLENPVKKSLYSWFIAGVALPMMILSDNWMGVVAGMFLMLDFAAPTGGSRLNMSLHVLGADMGMLLGTAMLGFIFGQWWIVAIEAFICLAIYFANKYIVDVKVIIKGREYLWHPKNATWWIEITVLVAVWIGLLIEKVL